MEIGLKNPLGEINENISKFLNDSDKFGQINMRFRSVNMTFRFLEEIIFRFNEDRELYQQYMKIYYDISEPQSERDPTEEEKIILEKWTIHHAGLNLDIEDFFIHSNILMDKIARLSNDLLKFTKDTDSKFSEFPNNSFFDHRNYFIKLTKLYTIDEEYAKYIRDNTGWYISQLKNPRDDLIVHEDVPKFWTYNFDGGKSRISRIRHNIRQNEKLLQLKEKYYNMFPELADETNFFTLLNSFELNSGKLQSSDVHSIKEIRKRFGGTFPDINILFKNIYEHMIFLNHHFLQKISKLLCWRG